MGRVQRWRVMLRRLNGPGEEVRMTGELENTFRLKGREYHLRRIDREKQQAIYDEVRPGTLWRGLPDD